MMRWLGMVTIALSSFGWTAAAAGQQGIPEVVREVVEARIAEVREARSVEAMDVGREQDYQKILRAAREGSPYVRFAAARKLRSAPQGLPELEKLAGEFRDSMPRLADFCTALAVVKRAEGMERADAKALYVAHLRDESRPFGKQMLGALHLEEAKGVPSEAICAAAGLRRVSNSSPVVLYHSMTRKREGDSDSKHVSGLLDVLEASVLPARDKDPSFPARVQATVAALIDAGQPATTALLDRYGAQTQPPSERDYLVLLYVIDVFQGAGEERALPFLRRLESVPPLDEGQRKFVAMHRAGTFEIPKAAIVAQAWIESGERYPYHDWLVGWYKWFVDRAGDKQSDTRKTATVPAHNSEQRGGHHVPR